MQKIQKRNGTIVDFNIKKIKSALINAFSSLSKQCTNLDLITKEIVKSIDKKFENEIPNVESIQDIIELTLIKNQEIQVAKSYIAYREKRSENRKIKKVTVDVENTISEYLNKKDWRINANSNQGYSLGGMILNTSGKVTANYWLSHIYPKNIGELHRNADYHIHDLDMFSGYCAGWSLRALLELGFNGIEGKVESNPPKNLHSAISQIINFLGTLQNEWAGAQAFSSFDTYLAPFVKKYSDKIEKEIKELNPKIDSEKLINFIDKKTYEYVYQNMQSFIFNINIPSKWGMQTPFTNLTFDWVCPQDLKNKTLNIDGKPFKYNFGELQKEMDIINKAYIKAVTKGDAKGRVFTFPIPTYNITKDFPWKMKTLIYYSK